MIFLVEFTDLQDKRCYLLPGYTSIYYQVLRRNTINGEWFIELLNETSFKEQFKGTGRVIHHDFSNRPL